MKKLSLPLLGASALILSACAQQPVGFVHKGDQFFGRNGASYQSYAANSSGGYSGAVPPSAMQETNSYVATAPTEQAVPVDNMGVSTLDELTVSEPAPVEIASAAPQPMMSMGAPAPVNTPETLEPLPALGSASADELATADVIPTDIKPSLTAVAEPVETPINQAFIWPVDGEIISRFGPKQNGLMNDGINISAKEGEPIWASAEGEVVYSGNELKGYGNMAIVRHSGGLMTAYAHASDILVNKGDKVKQGDLLGYVGKTGSVKTAQLHFGIREGNKPINPEQFLPQRVASAQ